MSSILWYFVILYEYDTTNKKTDRRKPTYMCIILFTWFNFFCLQRFVKVFSPDRNYKKLGLDWFKENVCSGQYRTWSNR